jgi:hypothetical protein
MIAIASLGFYVMSFFDARQDSVHRFMVQSSNRFIPDMPDELTTLRTARHYWSLIMRRNYHFIRIVLSLSKSAELCKAWNYTDDGPWEGSANLKPGANMFTTPKEPPIEMLPDSVRYQEEVRRWSRASAVLFDRL